MGITPGTFTAGTPITENAVRTELSRIRDWINDTLLANDFPSASLSKSTLVRPVTSGFPNESVEGVKQGVWEMNDGIVDPCPIPSLVLDNTTSIPVTGVEDIADSHTAFLLNLDNDSFRFMGKRVPARGNGSMEFVCTVFAATTNDNGQGLNTNAGNLRLRYRAPTGVVSDVPGSVRKLNPAEVVNLSRGYDTLRHSQYDIIGDIDTVEGVYDVWLEYRRNNASVDLGQVTIAVPTLLIETHAQ